MLNTTMLAGFGGSETDPYFSSVVALLHFDGVDAATTITDVKGHTFTANGNAQLNNGQAKFGATSAQFDGTDDSISSADHVDWEMGSGDFTMEFWVRFASVAAGTNSLLSKIDSAATDYMSFGILRSAATLVFYASADGASFFINGVSFASGLSVNTWYHVAVNRTGTAWRGYIDGVGTALATSSSSIQNSAFSLRIGGPPDSDSFNGWIDELRITKGVGRYPANFTRPAFPFPDM